MKSFRTHYDNLGVSRKAPPEVIKAAYRALAQKYHPDKNPDPDAVRILQIINEAYRVLCDPELRAAHDAWIDEQDAKSYHSSFEQSNNTYDFKNQGHGQQEYRHHADQQKTPFNSSNSNDSNINLIIKATLESALKLPLLLLTLIILLFKKVIQYILPLADRLLPIIKRVVINVLAFIVGLFILFLGFRIISFGFDWMEQYFPSKPEDITLENTHTSAVTDNNPIPPHTSVTVLPESDLASDLQAEQEDAKQNNEISKISPTPLALPKTGYTNKKIKGVAPLNVKTDRDGHYWLKIVDLTDQEIASYFIRGGDSLNIKLPAGTYKIRYAHGQHWYGEDELFGKETDYAEASDIFIFDKYTGYNIELIRQINGNLHTQHLNASQF